MARHPFASPAWIASLRRYLDQHATELGKRLEGRSFSVCEVYEHVPGQVNERDTIAISWEVGPAGLRFEEIEREDVDLKVVAEWSAIAPLAEIAVRGDAGRAADLRRGMVAGLKGGTIRVVSRGASPAFMDRVHDDMADRTG